MPIIQSAIKSAKQNEVRRRELLPVRTSMKTMIRTVRSLVKEGKKEEAAALLPAAYSAIDTAAKKEVIHGKNAARKKSGLAKLLS